MSHSYSNVLIHAIFSTKDRAHYLDRAIRGEVHAYFGGIVNELKGTPVIVGGVDDHVHALLLLPPDVSISDCLRVAKTNTSRWIHEKWPDRGKFAWQAGFAAFSVSESNRAAVINYIREQEQHHRNMTFQEELIAFLRKNGVAYDERYIWS